MLEKKQKTVYVVHCVDTEGPLYEEKTVPFDMVKNIFGLDVEPSADNLKRMQQGTLNLGGYEKEVQKLVDPHRITTRGSWQEIDEMLKNVMSESYRKKLLDSAGKGWIFNWFCMAHVGFSGENPRRRVTGYHSVYDHYKKIVDEQAFGDHIGFHYHPIPISGNYHESGTSYWGGENINQIMCRNIIEREWFPATFRPGFHTERPDSNWFLEQWIPFDYGNQSVTLNAEGQNDMANGRFGDWRRAPKEWIPYHPAHDDYQSKGQCKRWIGRCLNMYARIRQISQEDVDYAFENARQYGSSILAFTNHDYKDMQYEIERVREMIRNADERFEDVQFLYVDAVEAMRRCLDLKYEEFDLELNVENINGRTYLDIKVDKEIFGPQPFLAIKTKKGRYIWENLDFYIKDKEWTYTFDNNTIAFEDVEKIGVASNNSCGVTKLAIYANGVITKREYNVR